MALPPKKDKGFDLMIAVGKGGKKPFGAPSPIGGDLSKKNNKQEKPGDEEAYHDRGETPSATPESVCFRTADQTCGNCEYNHDGGCDFLRQAVDAGDSCGRFEAKTEDEESGEMEAAEPEEEEAVA